MNGKNYIFTDSDLDGVGSLLVVKWLVDNDISYKTTTYRNFREDFLSFLTNNKLSDYDNVFICDLNVSEHCDILNYKNITVIDHHNGKDNYDGFNKTELILDSNYSSTTKLTLKYIINNYPKSVTKLTKKKAKLIELIDDYDCYRLAHKESIGLNQVLWSYTGNRVEKFIEDFKEGFEGFNLYQKNMITLANKKIINALKTDDGFIYETNIDGKPKRLVSLVCNHNINEIACGLLKKYKCDIAFIVNPKSKSVSVRKRKGDSTNLCKLASKLCEGGGHTDSAGGKLNETFLKFSKLFKPVALA